jgi:DNA-binding transcriptional MerR regulator
MLATAGLILEDAAPVGEDADRQYTIDELASVTRVPSRTIRFYQSKGALPAPQIRGRSAYYGAEHVERLKLIGSLQDRGLRIRAIRDLLQQADKGELALNEWLGLERQLQEPWANDRPRVMTEDELQKLVGAERPGAVAELAKLEQIERRGDSYLVKSPALLQVALRLEAAGIDLETGVGAGQILRKHLRRATEDLVEFFYKRSGEGFGRDISAGDLADAYKALRPLGQESVRVTFGQEMERALRKLLESGATAVLPAKAKRKKRRR